MNLRHRWFCDYSCEREEELWDTNMQINNQRFTCSRVFERSQSQLCSHAEICITPSDNWKGKQPRCVAHLAPWAVGIFQKFSHEVLWMEALIQNETVDNQSWLSFLKIKSTVSTKSNKLRLIGPSPDCSQPEQTQTWTEHQHWWAANDQVASEGSATHTVYSSSALHSSQSLPRIQRDLTWLDWTANKGGKKGSRRTRLKNESTSTPAFWKGNDFRMFNILLPHGEKCLLLYTYVMCAVAVIVLLFTSLLLTFQTTLLLHHLSTIIFSMCFSHSWMTVFSQAPPWNDYSVVLEKCLGRCQVLHSHFSLSEHLQWDGRYICAYWFASVVMLCGKEVGPECRPQGTWEREAKEL